MEDDEYTFYTILDEQAFCQSLAKSVAECFDSDSTTEVFGYVTQDQMLSFVRERSYGFDHGNMVINAKIYEDTVNDIAQSMQGKMLSKLAAEGYLNCAWDDKINDMIFWLADQDENEQKNIT